jgi:hypothetical protein
MNLALLLQAASAGEGKTTPVFPVGILVAWWVCNSRRRQEIGGWLLFFYWQLYGGLLTTAAFFALNIQSYVPENFDSPSRYALFLCSAAPTTVLFVVEVAVATVLISARTWDMLKLLRWVIVAEIGAAAVGTVIDAMYFPDNLGLSALTIIPALSWLAYFFRSTRIKHVFDLQDWEVAVKSIYPSEPGMAT